jgi:hypothetical protein
MCIAVDRHELAWHRLQAREQHCKHVWCTCRTGPHWSSWPGTANLCLTHSVAVATHRGWLCKPGHKRPAQTPAESTALLGIQLTYVKCFMPHNDNMFVTLTWCIRHRLQPPALVNETASCKVLACSTSVPQTQRQLPELSEQRPLCMRLSVLSRTRMAPAQLHPWTSCGCCWHLWHVSQRQSQVCL